MRFLLCLALATLAACGDDQRHVSEEMCFLPTAMESNRDVDACPDAWDEETVERAEGELTEDESLQNIVGPEPDVVDFEGEPWLMSCCYTVYSAGDTSWPLL